jgi:hypothetical protein
MDPTTGIRRTVSLAGSGLNGTHRHLAVTAKHRRTEPLMEDGVQIGWHTEHEHWCLQWAERVGCGTSYEPPIEEGFRTKREATERKREIYKELGWQ